jgi:predicted nucleic acid-binding protein
MNGRAVYLDASAFVKLFLPEPESGALRAYLQRWPIRVSADLLRTQALRVAMRLSGERVAEARRQLRGVSLIQVDGDIWERAGTLPPLEMRSLDAIHVSAALSLGDDLAELITYDERMAAGGAAHGLSVRTPA